MTITTAQSVTGFVTSLPVESNEAATRRIDMTIGQPRRARDAQGNEVWAAPEECHLIMRGWAAERMVGQFRIGDAVVASGRMESEQIVDAEHARPVERQVFVAERIGPDTGAMSYEQILARRVHPRPRIPGPPPAGPLDPSWPFGPIPPGQAISEAPRL
jgi:hypothetical protein